MMKTVAELKYGDIAKLKQKGREYTTMVTDVFTSPVRKNLLTVATSLGFFSARPTTLVEVTHNVEPESYAKFKSSLSSNLKK
ncbi:hypothetical protein FACS1894208_00600 [Clostridia bacterium]|nr:hypothetical protein FACS1894208_00600 [Clostridia bacterium]